MSDQKIITEQEQLEIGREYWVRYKFSSSVASYIAQCIPSYGGIKMIKLGTDNSVPTSGPTSAFETFDVFGPLEIRNPPTWEEIIKD